MRQSFTLVILALLATTTLTASRTRKIVDGTFTPEQLNALVKMLTAEELKSVCMQSILNDGSDFFHKWVIRNVADQGFDRPALITGVTQNMVNDHLTQLNSYINEMTLLSNDLHKFSRFLFDAQIKDLSSRVNEIVGREFNNPYDNGNDAKALTENLGPYAQHLVKELANKDIQPADVQNIGDIYRQEDLQPESNQDPEVKKLVEKNKKELRTILHRIIRVYTNNDSGKLYTQFTPEQKAFVETFFNAFRYLMPPQEHQDNVLKNLISDASSLKKAIPDHKFINQPLYNYMENLNTEYSPLFYRDNFITRLDPDYKLEDLHSAATPTLFSWDFFKSFDNQDYANAVAPSLDVKKDESLDQKVARKKARLHAMLYKVYTLARDDGTLPVDHSPDNTDILRKLYSWVLNNAPKFAAPVMTDEGLKDNHHKMHTLFEPKIFRRYYLPLLDLICQKLGMQCGLLEGDKPQVIRTFIDFGNHNELTDSPIVKAVITPQVLDAITIDSGIQEFENFIGDIDDLADALELPDEPLMEKDLFAEDFNSDADRPDTPREAPKLLLQKRFNPPSRYGGLPEFVVIKDKETSPVEADPTRRRRRRKHGKGPAAIPQRMAPEQVQDNFNKVIGDRFLPIKDGEPMSPQKLTQLGKFIDTVNSIENPKRKRRVRHLLMNFVIKTKAKDFVDKFVKDQLAEHSAPIDYKQSQGLRNFLFATMNSENRYVPTTADDEYNYSLDILFFIINVSKANLLNLRTSTPAQFPAAATKFKKDLQTINNEFISAKPSGSENHVNRVNILGNKLDEVFLERASGIEFFRHFLDFFTFYETIEEEARATNVDFYRIYLQFYQIVAHLRRGGMQAQAFDNPHDYLLFKITECMAITEENSAFIALHDLNTHCVFSYRKYAEVLYFYKLYLIRTKKEVSKSMVEHQREFDVHTRMFLSFAYHNDNYRMLLDNQCQDHPELKTICVSWSIFKSVINYLHNADMDSNLLKAQMSRVATGTTANKINMFNGFEAAHFYSRSSNVKDEAKFLDLFKTEGVDNKESVGELFAFTPSDEKELARYLSLTYKKLSFDRHEITIIKLVNYVLETEEGGNSDALILYLTFMGRVAPFYMKLFLQYAQTDAHFARLARVLINNEISSNLVAINGASKDSFFRKLVEEVDGMEQSDVPMFVLNRFQEEYAKTFQQCQKVAVNDVFTFLNDDEFMEMLGEDIPLDQPSEKNVSPVSPEKALKEIKKIQQRGLLREGENMEDYINKVKAKLINKYAKKGSKGSFDLELEQPPVEEEWEDVTDDEDSEGSASADPYKEKIAATLKRSVSGKIKDMLDQSDSEGAGDEEEASSRRSSADIPTDLREARELLEKRRHRRRSSSSNTRRFTRRSGSRGVRRQQRPEAKKTSSSTQRVRALDARPVERNPATYRVSRGHKVNMLLV